MLNRLQDVFKFFQQHEVKYLVIDGVASVIYGVPRATFDLDILIEATNYQGQDFFILSKEDLINTKRASGRKVDLEDVRLLELPDQDKTMS